MAFKGLTVNTPETEEAHIFAEDDAAIYKAIFGDGDMILPYGENFAVSIQSYNTVRVASGLLAMQGHVGIIESGDYQDITLDNGASGITRIDLIVAQFATTGMHGTDSFTLEVIKGTDNSGTPPVYTAENLNSNGKLRQLPIAQVVTSGLTVTTVTMLHAPVMTMAEMQEVLQKRITFGTETPSGGENGDIYIKYEA